MNPKPKILIIEDNTDLNNMFKTAFESKGFEVAVSINGIEGITKAAEFKPDVILLDLMMPQMDGYEFLEALAKNTSLNPIVVVNSNLEQEKDAQRAIGLGAKYYLRKSEYTPFAVVDKIVEISKNPPAEKETLKSFAKVGQDRPNKARPRTRKILIIEDNEDLNKMFKTAFEAKNFEVEISLNGMDGITKAAAFRPDLILLDIMMPQMDGYEVLQAIKNNTSLDIIVVVNTNLDQKKDEEKALQMGANYFYRKSEFTPFEIVDKVEAIFKE